MDCRCRTIPLVSKHFNAIHKAYPPQPAEWFINMDMELSGSAVRWFQRIAGSVEHLYVDQSHAEGHLASLPQLLYAAANAHKLRELIIRSGHFCNVHHQVMQTLGALHRITYLDLSDWGLTEAHQFSRLRSLQASRHHMHPRWIAHSRNSLLLAILKRMLFWTVSLDVPSEAAT